MVHGPLSGQGVGSSRPAPLAGPGSGKPPPRSGTRQAGRLAESLRPLAGRSSMMSPRWTTGGGVVARAVMSAPRKRVKRVRLSGQRQASSQSAPSSDSGSIGAASIPVLAGDGREGQSDGSSASTPRTVHSSWTCASGRPARTSAPSVVGGQFAGGRCTRRSRKAD